MSESAEMKVCTITDIGIEINGEDAPPLVAAINKYLSVFAKPRHDDGSGDQSCLKCGAKLNGFLGSFTQGIIHGEGTCGECGWPCRNIFNGPLEMILQYHPEHVTQDLDDE